MAAMRDRPPADAAGDDANTPAKAYVRRLCKEVLSRSVESNSRALLLLRQRPDDADFPAAVTAVLDDLEDLFSLGGVAMEAYEKQKIRDMVAEHRMGLRHGRVRRLEIASRICSLAADLIATSDRLRSARSTVRRTLERLAAVNGNGEGGGARETSAWVVSLVERLHHAQQKEAALMAATEAMAPDFEHLLRERESAEAEFLAEKTALKALAKPPPGSREDDDLLHEALGRYSEDVLVLLEFAGEFSSLQLVVHR